MRERIWSRKLDCLVPAHPQRVRDAIDVVEPGCDQRYLQNAAVVETRVPQAFDVIFPNLGGIFGQLDDIVEHHTVLG